MDKGRKRETKSFKCDSDNHSLTHFSAVLPHTHTHNVHHETVSEVHIMSYTGPLSKLCLPVQGLWVTHCESQSQYLGGGEGPAVTGASVKGKAQ